MSANRTFNLPDLGEGLTEAELVGWLVAVGDEIAVDQAIAEVETAKSIVELPSPYAGTVLALHGQAGERLLVGAPVIEVGQADGATPDAAGQHPGEPASATPADPELERHREEERAGSGNVLIGYGTSGGRTAGRRRPRRGDAGRGGAGGAGRGPGRGREPERVGTVGDLPARDARPVEPARTPATANATAGVATRPDQSPARIPVRSPIVRRLARDLGLDLRDIEATGSDGAITRADVLRAADSGAVATTAACPNGAAARSCERASGDGPAASTAPAAPGIGGTVPAAPSTDDLRVVSREPLSILRRTVSATLARSRAEIPEATVWVDVDATELWNLRRSMVRGEGTPPSLTAILARFTLLALAEFPVFASRLSDDATELIAFDGVNLGIAADTPRGLMVPSIPRADRLTIGELDETLREVAELARAGVLPPERLRGSTFTLNNYGAFGVDGSAAIINHPEVAILGVGRMLERPWVVDGEIAPRRIVQLSLVFDHRVCDGGQAGGFLRHIADSIERPWGLFPRL